MFRLSKLTDYASLIVSYLVSSYPEHSNATAIAEATHLPLPTVSKILKTLAQKGLLTSLRGINGGYCLAREPGKIFVAELIEAMEGPLGITTCSTHQELCKLQPTCQVRKPWQRLNQVIIKMLNDMSVQELVVKDNGSTSTTY